MVKNNRKVILMIFYRFSLSYSINEAKQTQSTSIYSELLKIFYRLIEQEQINGVIINVFYYYEPISTDTLTFYLMQLKKFNH